MMLKVLNIEKILAQVHKISARRQHERSDRGAHLAGEPWYQEVIELRKQANDYKVSIMIKEHKDIIVGWKISYYRVCTMYKILISDWLALYKTWYRSPSGDGFYVTEEAF